MHAPRLNVESFPLLKIFARILGPSQMEARKAEDTSYFRLVQGVRGCSLVLLDADGRVQIWNEGAERLQGYRSMEAVGIPYSFFFSNQDIRVGKPERLLRKAAQLGSAEEEGWRYRKDGTRFWAKVLISALWDDLGVVSGFTAVTYDISKQKLAEDMLKTAKDSAEAASRAKTTFLANMSHEIRTPLGAVLGFAELLNDSSLTEMERNNYATTIQRSGAQLLTLINDILDLSKIEAERLELEIIEFNLRSLLKDVCSVAKSEIANRDKPIRIKVECDTGVPQLLSSDPTRIKQILTNLVGNAVKFTDEGFVSVHVSYDEPSKKRKAPTLSIVVRDTGIGMNLDQQANIFKPFSQGDGSITRKYGGTGLGLVLSRELARRMGGDLVLVESRPNQGSAFRVFLPVFTAPLRREDAPTSKELLYNSEECGEGQLRGLSILVAEDSADNKVLMERFLCMAGANVVLVQDGQSAVELAMKKDFDVVLMDIQMPIMDGIEATQKLRQQGYEKPIIAVTANALKEERDDCLRAGFNDHLSKPVSRSSLTAKVSALVRKPQPDFAVQPLDSTAPSV